MCQPVSYTYPGCTHLIAQPNVWVLDPCPLASSTGRWCHISQDYPLNLVEKRPWVGQPLEPCEKCTARVATAQRAMCNQTAFTNNRVAGAVVSWAGHLGKSLSGEEDPEAEPRPA